MLEFNTDTHFDNPCDKQLFVFLQNSANMVQQSLLPMLDTVHQNLSGQPFHGPVNTVPQEQLSSSSETAFRPAPLNVYAVEKSLGAISLIGDTNGNLDTTENRNMLQATGTGFQTTNEVMVGLRHPHLISSTNVTPPPNTASDMWAQSQGLTTSANASEIVQREQHIDSIANSSNLQVL